jgi:hypothetical protein
MKTGATVSGRRAACPFEWAGLYACEAGSYILELRAGPAPTISIAVLRVEADPVDAIREATEQAARLFCTGAVDRECGQVVLAGALHQRLQLGKAASAHFHTLLAKRGHYVLFTQYLPHEFNLTLQGPMLVGKHYFAPARLQYLPVSR